MKKFDYSEGIQVEEIRKQITRMDTSFFNDKIIEKKKCTSFDDEEKIVNEEDKLNLGVTKDKFNNRIRDIKNDKIKKSLMELTKIFREK